ncbi:phage tail protein [Asaia prunellae]|uniref:phage tail protein n=1 Tax=Asaia prunellae TaxID=610245 RepID=UPI0004725B7D|nr:phage tail protein [Asaia prunellae]
MPLESGTYVSDLVTTNPAHTDDVSQADSHIRLIKSALKATFPNFKGAITASHELINSITTALGTAGTLILDGTSQLTLTNKDGKLQVSGDVLTSGVTASGYLKVAGKDVEEYLFPSGGIIAWSGSATNIPAKWTLCDGSNGTPDLRGRFIIGAAGAYTAGATGGAETGTTSLQGDHNHGAATWNGGGFTATVQTDTKGDHAHGGNTQPTHLTTDQLPSHVHNAPRSATASVQTGTGTSVTLVEINGVSEANGPYTSATGSGEGHNHAIAADGAHQHSVTVARGDHTHGIASDGTHSHTVATLPPYYALCYIMKL